jgi:plasmid stabilization system protein ParE
VKKPRLAFSDAAIADILEQSDWYKAQADRSLAQRWEEAVTDTLSRIAQRPTAGSRCRFTAGELRGTRRMPVAGFTKFLIL